MMIKIKIKISLSVIMNVPKEAVLKSSYGIINFLIYLFLRCPLVFQSTQQLIQTVEGINENKIEVIQTQKSDTVPTIEFTPQ